TVNAPLAPSTPVAPPPAVSTPAAPTPPSAVTAAETGGQVAAFNAWLEQFKPKAVAAGVPQAVVDRELNGLTPNPRVISLDGRQPEFSKPVGDYIKGVISDDRVAVGRGKRDQLAFLPAVEQRYGVPRDILLAVWAMESAFGKIQGDFDVVRSMASLAADGRRRGWAEG
ncbi:lytic murein transglycosylase, partial [Achromobacter sp. PAB15]|uniref:lytic murein transglycosylase n=1 Tax=Achromobacter sp. PAB15 TaxID=3233048 RepID=UPI003F90B72D